MPRARRWSRVLILLGMGVMLASCADNAPQDFFDPAGEPARKIDDLQRPIFLVAGIVFVVVQVLVVAAIVKFRRRTGDEEIPEQIHGNTRLEIGWTILPALVLGVVGLFTLPQIFAIAENPPEGSIEVEVTGQKYWWAFSYPEQAALGNNAPIVTANELHIPAGQPIKLTLRSEDSIHSFWAPRLNGKRDVVPGRVHDWNIHADEPGVYSGQCAEFCGTSHANMRLKVVAHSAEDWEEWLALMQTPPRAPTSGAAAVGFELFGLRGCAGCHRVEGQYEEVAEGQPSAPDLTYLYTRDCFAGCIYDLNDRNEMEAWLRNPQRKAGSLMVIGALTDDEIDSLVAYMETLE